MREPGAWGGSRVGGILILKLGFRFSSNQLGPFEEVGSGKIKIMKPKDLRNRYSVKNYLRNPYVFLGARGRGPGSPTDFGAGSPFTRLKEL